MKTPDKINGITREVIGKWLSCRAFPCEKERCIDCERYPGDDADVRNAAKATLAYIQQLEAAQPKWISVEERLPPGANGMDFCALVLVCTREGCVTAGWNNDGKWHLINWDDDFISRHSDGFVTHWMYMPEPPEEET